MEDYPSVGLDKSDRHTQWLRRRIRPMSYREEGSFYVQHQRFKFCEDLPDQSWINWKFIQERSISILSTREKIRSKVMRRFVNIARTNMNEAKVEPREWCEKEGVVYCCIHPPTGKFYIGQTKFTVLHRFQVHYYQRNQTKIHSTLSAYLTITNLYQYFILPLYACTDEKQRQSVEAGYIQRYQTNRGMLNDEDKHYRARRYNRQHGRHHEEPEKRQTATNIPSQRKRNVYNLVRKIERVDNKKAASIIARLGKRKLQDVQHTTTLERIRQQCIQARVNLQKGRIPTNKQIVFNFQLHRKVNPRKIIMQDCPFPPNVKKFVRIRNKLNPIFLTRNCHHDAMHLDEELSHATCMCASLRTSTNTKHFRADDKGEYHLATNDPDVLSTFLQSQGIQQNHLDEFCMVWEGGSEVQTSLHRKRDNSRFRKKFCRFRRRHNATYQGQRETHRSSMHQLEAEGTTTVQAMHEAAVKTT